MTVSYQANPPSDAPSTLGIPALVLVSTPIGNLKDMSLRAQETLVQADMILCEDTRTSQVLLRHYGIDRPCLALHEHNEEMRIEPLLQRMREGVRYALISDAGTPLISDPGFRLARAAIEAGLPVSAVPGANAAVLALTLSGLPPHPFLFLGFLPPRPGARQTALRRLASAEAAGLSATLVLHEAPHRVAETLQDAAAILGPRPAALCRELTKRFEEVRRDRLDRLASFYAQTQARGEITLVIGPPLEASVSEEALAAALVSALDRMSMKDAVDAVSQATGVARRQVYAKALSLSGRNS